MEKDFKVPEFGMTAVRGKLSQVLLKLGGGGEEQGREGDAYNRPRVN